MKNKIIDKFLKFIEIDVSPTIKKDFTWLRKNITKDLGYLQKNNLKKLTNNICKLFVLNIPYGWW